MMETKKEKLGKKDIKGIIIFIIIMLIIVSFVSLLGFLFISYDNQNQDFFRTECLKYNLSIYFLEDSNRISYCYKIEDGILIKYYIEYIYDDMYLSLGETG